MYLNTLFNGGGVFCLGFIIIIFLISYLHLSSGIHLPLAISKLLV